MTHKIPLDKVSKKVLHLLDLNGRTPVSKITKEIKASREVIQNRLNKMYSSGLIQASSCEIDPAAFGFITWKVFITFQNLTNEVLERIMRKLSEIKNIARFYRCQGKYDCYFAVYAKTVYEYNEVMTTVSKEIGEYIFEIAVTNPTSQQFFPRGYLFTGESKPKCESYMKEMRHENIDQVDKDVLLELIKNSRSSVINIARKLDLTIDIVAYRIKNLIEKKILASFMLVLDVTKIGLNEYKALIYLQKDYHHRKIVDYLVKEKLAFYICKTAGNWQMEISLEMPDDRSAYEMLNKMTNDLSPTISRYDLLLLSKKNYNFSNHFVNL